MRSRALLLAIGLLFASLSAVLGQIPAAERQALIALYYSTNGDAWTNNSGWKTPPLHTDGFAMPGTEGSWFGVTVEDSPDSHVVSIVLYANNLAGNIPHEIGAFPYLRALQIFSNPLAGTLPPELGDLVSLKSLFLEGNQLSGSIPAELGTLANLEVLYLYQNKLTGPIPPELGNLGSL